MKQWFVLYTVLLAAACANPPAVSFTAVPSGTTALLQAVSVAADGTIWISGHKGNVTVSSDSGRSFKTISVPGADTLQFRDVHAFDGKNAVLMAAGPGVMSSIWRTEDGGALFTRVFQNEEPAAFYDCMSFWDNGTGFLFGDSIREQLFLMKSADSGKTWQRVSPENLPAALPGEGAFAASGTCIRMLENGTVYIATGAGGAARLLISADSGRSFSASNIAGETGDAAGWATVSGNADHVFLLGGNLATRDDTQKNFSHLKNGSWITGPVPGFRGAVYGSSFHPERGLLASGPGGVMFLPQKTTVWSRVDTLSMWAVEWFDAETAFAAGPNGRIYKIKAGR